MNCRCCLVFQLLITIIHSLVVPRIGQRLGCCVIIIIAINAIGAMSRLVVTSGAGVPRLHPDGRTRWREVVAFGVDVIGCECDDYAHSHQGTASATAALDYLCDVKYKYYKNQQLQIYYWKSIRNYAIYLC